MRSYKTELAVNNYQRTLCLKSAGAARWAYNWAIDQKQAAYQNGEKYLNAIALHKRLNQLKKTDVPWMYEISKCAPQEALRNCDDAFQRFFDRCKDPKIKKKGYPKHKSKKRNGIGSFSLNGSIRVGDRYIQLPRLGKVKLKEHSYLPVGTRVKSATVSEHAGHWFVSILTDEEPIRTGGTEVIGVDVGLKHLATLSDGTKIENPQALKSNLRLIKIRHKAISRKQKGSQNRAKARQRLAKTYYRVACIRSNALHQATAAITKRSAVVVVEDLNIQGMLKNRRLARAIADVGWYEFKRQLAYKLKQTGGELIIADRFYPSSKTCSACGHVLAELKLSTRAWTCPQCETQHDRDVNAAMNLKQWAASSAVTACRLAGAGSAGSARATRPVIGQEPNTRGGQTCPCLG